MMEEVRHDKEWKRILVEILKKLKLIDDRWTGEIVIGINEGIIKFIRRSE
jgi:hypothetical protein